MEEQLVDEVTQLKHKAVESVEYYRELANKKHGLSMAPFTITFTNKGRAAGTAHLGKHTISLNLKVMALNPERFFKRTTGHEVAHFVVYYLHHKRMATARFKTPMPKAHGREWLSVMMSLGITDNSARNNYKMGTGTPKPKSLISSNYQSVHGQVSTFGVGKIVEFD